MKKTKLLEIAKNKKHIQNNPLKYVPEKWLCESDMKLINISFLCEEGSGYLMDFSFY